MAVQLSDISANAAGPIAQLRGNTNVPKHLLEGCSERDESQSVQSKPACPESMARYSSFFYTRTSGFEQYFPAYDRAWSAPLIGSKQMTLTLLGENINNAKLCGTHQASSSGSLR